MWQPRAVSTSSDVAGPAPGPVTPPPGAPGPVRPAARFVVAAAIVVALAGGCVAGGEAEVADDPGVRVAAAPDGEGALLAAVVVLLLDAADVPAVAQIYQDPRDGQQALELGAVDIRPGYTGEAWLESLGRADPPGDPRTSFGPVRAADARQGITWLEPAFGDPGQGRPANATFAFVVPADVADDTDLRTISQLAARLEEQPDARVCVDREFGTRDDGLRAVLDAYGVRTDRPFLAAAPEDAVAAVAAGECLAGLTTATDGAAWAADLRPLVDDLTVFPAFAVAMQVRDEVLREQPQIEAALAPLATELTTTRLARWNGQVVSGTPTEEVAREAVDELRAAVADAEVASGEE